MTEEARTTPEVAVEGKTEVVAIEKKTDVVVVELKEESVAVSTEKTEDVKPTPPPVVEEEKKISQSASFKEESNKVDDLADLQKKALEELKELVRKALDNHEFTSPPPPVAEVKAEEKKEEEKEEKKEKKEGEPIVEDKKEAIQAEKVAVEEKVAEIPVVAKEKQAASEEDKPTLIEAVDTVETVAVTTATTAEDDGVKTVEAIEESVVSVVSAPSAPPPESKASPPAAPEEVFIWGIPLLGDDRSDVLLLKFLRARDFKVKDAFSMLKDTVKWRKEFGIDELMEEGLGNDFEKVVFIHGVDKENHPVCYNVYGEFQDKELYKKAFSAEEKGKKFLKWRILFLEKGIRQFEFSPDGVCSFVQVNDLKNFPVFGKKGLWHVTNQAVHVLQDNYPEFVAKQVFINAPWWYLTFNRMISPFLTQRTKSKCVYSGPARSAETLFKYIAPEHVPVQYGGLSQEKDENFNTADPVIETTIKLNSKEIVEIPISEPSVLLWELRVLGWDVTYGAEFVPDAENGYTVIIQKPRKMVPSDEAIVKNSYKIGEPGKVVFTIDNHASKKKKKLLYRTKVKSSSD